MTNDVHLRRLVVIEEWSDGPETDELAQRVARKKLEIDPLRYFALLPHRLCLLAHRALDGLRDRLGYDRGLFERREVDDVADTIDERYQRESTGGLMRGFARRGAQ
ncbi:MAG: hypothetical protein WBY94_20270, partial [Polyangiaceae bacterium]